MTLAEARARAAAARKLVEDGLDPIEVGKRSVSEPPPVPTFGQMADEVVASLEEGWRNDKHRAQWRMTLTTYAKPLRDKLVSDIRTEDVLVVLKPIWLAKPETASRLRGRIERVLDAAKAKGHRSGENPAAWRGNLAHLLPTASKLKRGHRRAVDFRDVGAVVTSLRATDGLSARALEFTILTAARSGEVLGARWCEFDLEAKVWTVPADRMKAGREHRVPLSGRALELLAQVAVLNSKSSPNAFVFPGEKPGRPLSSMSMAMQLRRLKVDGTVHGFRSSFRDWAGEVSTFPSEVAEAALAHVVGDKTERAYRRGDALEKRRKLMEAWANYVGTAPSQARVARLSVVR